MATQSSKSSYDGNLSNYKLEIPDISRELDPATGKRPTLDSDDDFKD